MLINYCGSVKEKIMLMNILLQIRAIRLFIRMFFNLLVY